MSSQHATITDTTVRANHLASGQSDRALFELTLRPYRALSRAGVRRLMLFFGLALTLGAIRSLFIGAYPVAIFLILDLLLVGLAIHISIQTGKSREVITLTKTRLIVSRFALGRNTDIATMEPYWAKIETRPRRRAPGTVIIKTHGSSIKFGHFLSDNEREDVAKRLDDALIRWRAGSLAANETEISA